MSGPSPQRDSGKRAPSVRGWIAGLGATVLATIGVLAPTIPAAAASGPDGQSVTVSQSTGLNPAGQTVTVTGSGFDTSKGIYVALCVDNGPGRAPSPCVGGVDMEGAGGASAWISSNPPAYGEGLAVPFTEAGGRGSFSASISVSASDPFVDCLDPAQAPNGCVVGTRADHTRGGDRTADVRIPVTFATAGAGDADSASGSDGAAPAADGADQADAGDAAAEDGALASTGAAVTVAVVVAVLLVALGALAVRLRRSSTDATSV